MGPYNGILADIIIFQLFWQKKIILLICAFWLIVLFINYFFFLQLVIYVYPFFYQRFSFSIEFEFLLRTSMTVYSCQ
jgi:hypothetical protein